MIRLPTVAIATCCLAIASSGAAATIDDLERQIRDVLVQRQAAERERSRLATAAAALADVISTVQLPRGVFTRASASLERQLRDFDRLSGQLDSADRAIKGQDATIARLGRAVGAEIDKQTRDLSRADPRMAAARALQLEAVRHRLDAMIAGPPTFRPLLVARPAAADTVADLDQKLAILAVEQARGADSLGAFDRDLSVLEGRAVVTRRLLDGLESTTRGAPQDLRLVQRQVDEVHVRLRELEVKRTDLRQVRDAVVTGLANLEQQIRECRARRAELIKG